MSKSDQNHRIRTATPEDAESILKIYSPYVLNTVVSFETEVPTIEEMRSRIQKTLVYFPWLVYEDPNGKIGGYAYAGKHGTRPGYRWTAETTVYLSDKYFGLGIGQKLYSELFKILRDLGYYKIIALATGDNERSVDFHTKMGFKLIGKGSNIGYKLNRWVDVNWLERDLQAVKDTPEDPKLYSQL